MHAGSNIEVPWVLQIGFWLVTFLCTDLPMPTSIQFDNSYTVLHEAPRNAGENHRGKAFGFSEMPGKLPGKRLRLIRNTGENCRGIC